MSKIPIVQADGDPRHPIVRDDGEQDQPIVNEDSTTTGAETLEDKED